MTSEHESSLPEGKMPQLRVVPMPADANVHGDADLRRHQRRPQAARLATAGQSGRSLLMPAHNKKPPDEQAVFLQTGISYAAFFSSRSSRRRIFPTFVFGKSLRNSIYFGFL